MLPPLITLEEHFFSAAASSSPTMQSQYSEQFKHIPGLSQKLSDLSTLRLSSMDAGQVSFQIISHAPGSLTPEECRKANDQLHSAIQLQTQTKQPQGQPQPKRFAGFAVLPVSDPSSCASELTRCIKDLGFVGALIDNHSDQGTYFDGDDYFPLWSAAASLDVPIYLHPTWPTPTQFSALYMGNFPMSASKSLSASGFGWHSDVATHVLRLVASGLFDKLPTLKIIIGHMGEMLPFMLARIVQLSPRWGQHRRPFKDVWDTNIWITTSGNWSVDPMATILRNTQVGHILYSVDYPFARNEDGLEFMRDLQKSGLVTEQELEMIAYKNAEALLGVKATTKMF
ncbi:hypothetical protein LTR47_007862 [Exophiala xenobiotica]|nr:hypothetical protein LTR92_006790 [Exophiala xenobiotica]KAK5221205.1 hypothetical protein LTR72_006765 [Exophiala xenobiotica]KAK5229260.1 hypothetical protein LTR47_007862 [Exophiala xenobiotica]KAK5248052.1 hypothetical protein LTS06_006920 [Exophiala xenobiotica]KAK5286083.1 hypothetical protein LTR14_010337 [Exophiala xenobiotica]